MSVTPPPHPRSGPLPGGLGGFGRSARPGGFFDDDPPRRRRRKLEEAMGVDLSPLIDCVFLLLIFFLVTTMMKKLQKEIPITIPDPEASLRAVEKRETLIVGLDREGRHYRAAERDTKFGELEYDPVENLAAHLKAYAEANGTELPLRIDVDRDTPFQDLVDTLDIAALQGFENVGVRTRDVEKLYFEVPPEERIERF
ncbi:MAG: ExbD/TolR family protein [Puniceicoccaceae bacterium]